MLQRRPVIKNEVIFGLFLLALILAGSLFLLNKKNTVPPPVVRTLTVELKATGFVPAEIMIEEGQTVTFINRNPKDFWPASDDHPSHTIYPEFDPKQPIAQNGAWSFKFDKSGDWKYHDHLSPYFTGIVHVQKPGAPQANVSDCANPHSYNCWQEQLVSTLKTEGVDSTFILLKNLYSSEPDFDLSCHNLAHTIGNLAYNQYVRDKYSVLSPKAAYCANGFYHGFVESLLTATDWQTAKQFCTFVDENLSKIAPDAMLQCYHGIGHGAMEVSERQNLAAKDEQSLIDPALKICKLASDTSDEIYRCVSGAYNVIANYYLTNQHGLKVRASNPLWFCDSQPDEYKESCYGNMNGTLLWYAKSFDKAVKYVERISQDKFAISAMRYLAGASSLSFARQNPVLAIKDCRKVQKRLQPACIQGFAHGFLEHGTPNFEYQDAINFCNNKEMTGAERDTCFDYSLRNLNGWYPIAKAEEICREVDVEFQKYCPKL